MLSCLFQQGARGRLGEGPAGADGDDALLGLHHVAVAGEDQRGVAVGHRQQRLQPAQHAVGAPVLGQFHGGARQVAAVLLELGLEALEQREGIGRAAGETRQDLILEQPPHLAGVALEHGVAQRDLTVTADDHAVAAPYREDRRAVELFHWSPPRCRQAPDSTPSPRGAAVGNFRDFRQWA